MRAAMIAGGIVSLVIGLIVVVCTAFASAITASTGPAGGQWEFAVIYAIGIAVIIAGITLTVLGAVRKPR